MQCMPLPNSPAHPPTEIRLFNDQGYDNGNFGTYPDRQGWTRRTAAEWVELFNKPPPELVAFLERWLFFGYAHTFLSVGASYFIKYTGSPSYPVLTTERLPALAKRLELSDFKRLDESAISVLIDVHSIHLSLQVGDPYELVSNSTRASMFTIQEFIDLKICREPRRASMAIATRALIETVEEAMLRTHARLSHKSLSDKFEPNWSLSASWISHFWKLLRDDGWCPSELRIVFMQASTSSLWFLYHLHRPSRSKTHTLFEIKDYSKKQPSSAAGKLCTAFSCCYRRLNDDDYITRHVKKCHGCNDVVANPKGLCGILKEGKIPLIVAFTGRSENARVLLQAAEPGCKYVAISHVWSDGLGNPRQNAIPMCQFVRLSNIVRGYQNTALFWLDTLCVPPDAAKLEEEQQIALELMRKTYEDAKAVLVLDSWTVQETHKDKSDVENLFKIFHCSWNSRLWTFQEGALAQTLVFQFKDGLYDVDKGIQRINANRDLSIEYTLKPKLISLHEQLRGFRKSKHKTSDLLKFITLGVATRATSVSSDEALCLAAMLDLDVKMIAQTESHLRMQNFWKMIEFVPDDILWSFTSPKMDVDGLRWAPKSLLGAFQPDIAFLQDRLLRHTKKGLLVTAPGFRLQPGIKFIGSEVGLADNIHNHYSARFFPGGFPEGFKNRSMAIDIEAYGGSQTALILDGRSGEDYRMSKSTGIMKFRCGAALVVIMEEDEECIYGRLICTGLLDRLNSKAGKITSSTMQKYIINGTQEIYKEIKETDVWSNNVALDLEVENADSKGRDKIAKLVNASMKDGSRVIHDTTTERMRVGEYKRIRANQKWCIG
ncbi:hypothetical protein J3E68DRAFT_83183 [Trichoderma sp. SZMC 28012]